MKKINLLSDCKIVSLIEILIGLSDVLACVPIWAINNHGQFSMIFFFLTGGKIANDGSTKFYIHIP